jgi:hypothetical protein
MALQDTFRRFEKRIQDLFSLLINGWAEAGGEVQCQRPGRIYLQFDTGEHYYGMYGKLSHKFNLVALTAPSAEEEPKIDVAWNLGHGKYGYLRYAPQAVKRFEEVVSRLPGFYISEKAAYLRVNDAFQEQHAVALLGAMVELIESAGHDESSWLNNGGIS